SRCCRPLRAVLPGTGTLPTRGVHQAPVEAGSRLDHPLSCWRCDRHHPCRGNHHRARLPDVARADLPICAGIPLWSSFLPGSVHARHARRLVSEGGCAIVHAGWLSMNGVMAGMIPVMVVLAGRDMQAMEATSLRFWGIMSLATLVGGVIAYPVNVWLVTKGLKHGMGSVRVLGAGGHSLEAEATRMQAVSAERCALAAPATTMHEQ